jgi:hypothetical protein
VLQYTTIKPSDDDVALKMRNLLFIDFSLSLRQQGLGFGANAWSAPRVG